MVRAILKKVDTGGCIALVAHLDTVASSYPKSAARDLLVIFSSFNTMPNLFIVKADFLSFGCFDLLMGVKRLALWNKSKVLKINEFYAK